MSIGERIAGRFHVVKPDVLGGEEVLLVERKDDLEDAQRAHPDLVAYTPRELRELERLRDHPGLVRAAHAIKKHLGASVIPRDSPLNRWSRGCVAIPAERFHGAREEDDGVA